MIRRRSLLLAATAAAATTTRPARASPARPFDQLPAAFAAIEARLNTGLNTRLNARFGTRLGVAVLDTGNGQGAGHRAQEAFPMGSTYKLLAAGAVLARADAGAERLDRTLPIDPAALVAYSPVTQAHPDGMTLAALCDAAVTRSDNTAGNLLLDVLGGPAGLTAFLRGLGDGATRLDRTEPSLNEATPGDPRDTTTPAAMLRDMHALLFGPALSAASRQALQAWLRDSRTGAARLRAGLPAGPPAGLPTSPPAGWTAGDKTGTAGHGTHNDVGVLWPPAGAAPIIVAAFLTALPADNPAHNPPDNPADDPTLGPARDQALAAVAAAIVAAHPG
ncbi:MAG: class A beta-lactamase [Janthinobacterium lividum]